VRRRSTLTGLLGQGVGPSLTPELHEREAQRHGVRSVYKVLDLTADETDPAQLRDLLAAAVRLGYDGLNVTHPIKQAMVPLVDRLAPEVAQIGALNTVVVTESGTIGHNTDVSGFARAFREELDDADLADVVLLGAGGAGTAVAHALAGLGAHRLRVVDPDHGRAARLRESVEELGHELGIETVGPDAAPALLARATGLVNATPIGMADHPGTPLDVASLGPGLWVADIVYRPLDTALLLAAAERGCRVLSGAGMAVHQAADAFELFTGLAADRGAMRRDFDELVAAERRDGLSPTHGTTGERNQ
jgi:shikimate dehydrogenase